MVGGKRGGGTSRDILLRIVRRLLTADSGASMLLGRSLRRAARPALRRAPWRLAAPWNWRLASTLPAAMAAMWAVRACMLPSAAEQRPLAAT